MRREGRFPRQNIYTYASESNQAAIKVNEARTPQVLADKLNDSEL